MLEALKVDAYTGDLGWLADFPYAAAPEHAWFFAEMLALFDNVSRVRGQQ